MPIVHGAVRGDRRNPSVVGPDNAAATGIGSRRLAFIEFADVPYRRGSHHLLHPSAIAVIDERTGGGRPGIGGHDAAQAIVDVKRHTRDQKKGSGVFF